MTLLDPIRRTLQRNRILLIKARILGGHGVPKRVTHHCSGVLSQKKYWYLLWPLYWGFGRCRFTSKRSGMSASTYMGGLIHSKSKGYCSIATVRNPKECLPSSHWFELQGSGVWGFATSMKQPTTLRPTAAALRSQSKVNCQG